MVKIEELPSDFDAGLDLNKPAPEIHGAASSSSHPPSNVSEPSEAQQKKGDSKREATSTSSKTPGNESTCTTPAPAGPALPSTLASAHTRSPEELQEMISSTPLFMTSLDDAADSSDSGLEALKALAYEGTPLEIAGNFRDQGNECFRSKKWHDAAEFYARGLHALAHPAAATSDSTSAATVQDDPLAITSLQKILHLNLAAAHIHLRNYRSALNSCARAIELDPTNAKPFYRSAQALLALSKLPEATDAIKRAAAIAPSDAAIATLSRQIATRSAQLSAEQQARSQREADFSRRAYALRVALAARRVATRITYGGTRPELEDAAISLADPLQPSSTLSYPVLLLYPLHAQSDFLKAVVEQDRVGEVLDTVLPPPWDSEGEYAAPSAVECYAETTTSGLAKLGARVTVATVLAGGKIEVVDGIVRVFVVPKPRAEAWKAEWKRRKDAQAGS
ncbi:MAG: hypothetical protein M1825_002513 [Sarcosagium campestre]|nr:MAG: hypothetical protein M1825_002513 [Sarcosagium campestre]